jgi:hypothetical protein
MHVGRRIRARDHKLHGQEAGDFGCPLGRGGGRAMVWCSSSVVVGFFTSRRGSSVFLLAGAY